MKNLIKYSLIGTLFLGAVSCNSTKKTATNKSPKAQQNDMRRVTEVFSRMDANGDGNISLSEAKGPLKNDFSKIDLDDNGLISKAEMLKAPKPERNGPPNGGQGGPQRRN